jgi:hypothetical protein
MQTADASSYGAAPGWFEGNAALLAKLMPEGYRARAKQAVLFKIEAWDANCSQHIPQKFDAADVAVAQRCLDDRVAALEVENPLLKQQLETERTPK